MSARRPDLALFLPSLRGGGAERVMMDLARAAADMGREVDVVVVNGHGAVTDDLGPGVRIVDLDRSRAAAALPALLRYLLRARPPALLSTLEHTNVLAVVATRLIRGTRVVLREANTPAQDLEYEGRKGRWLMQAMRWAYPAADAVVAVSQGVADGLAADLGLAPERIHVVFNPVITPRVLEGARVRPDHPWFAAGEPPVVLAVGRLAQQKGFDVLLRAFASARARAACRLVILGEGPEREALLESARRLGVVASVDLPGFVSNPFSYMAHCGVFVLSSRWEGLPNVLIQALAVGAPAVATDCPSGPREVLDGGRWGALVPVDDVEAMADAIVTALDTEPPRLPESWYSRYRVEDVVGAYLEILEPDGDVRRRGKELTRMARDPLRILLLTTSMLRGGAETQVYLLARAFKARGHAVHVVSMLEPEGYQSELADVDVELSSLGLQRGAMDPRGIGRLASVVRRWCPDVVHSHMVHANLLARVARPFGWAPVQVSTAHNITEGARWRELAYRATDPLSTLTTNVCEAGARRYVAIGATPATKMRPMPNGIVIESFDRPADVRRRLRDELKLGDRFAWLAVGRLERQKDYPTMLRAVADARANGSDAVVLVVGEGSLFDTTVAARDDVGLDDGAVRFLGSRADVPDLMAAADAYLMSSEWEGLPLVLLEASAAGLPIVATRVGGNDEIVADGHSGYLVPPQDPEALADAMIRLERLAPDERRAMGAAGARGVASRYEIERVADRWIELYQELLGDGRRG